MKKLYISHSVQGWNHGLDGYVESINCSVIASNLYQLLQPIDTIKVKLCKDSFTLAQIVADSNNFMPDLHLSIHSNAGAKFAEGTETLCLPGGKGERAAHYIHTEVLRFMRSTDPDRNHPDRGVKYGLDLYELNKTGAPAVLVEIGFHTNPDDVRQLVIGREGIAKALARGVLRTFFGIGGWGLEMES